MIQNNLQHNHSISLLVCILDVGETNKDECFKGEFLKRGCMEGCILLLGYYSKWLLKSDFVYVSMCMSVCGSEHVCVRERFCE